jgi:hypothetical protein
MRNILPISLCQNRLGYRAFRSSDPSIWISILFYICHISRISICPLLLLFSGTEVGGFDGPIADVGRVGLTIRNSIGGRQSQCNEVLQK